MIYVIITHFCFRITCTNFCVKKRDTSQAIGPMLCSGTLVRVRSTINLFKMSLVVRKPVFGVFDLVRHKLGCAASEDD